MTDQKTGLSMAGVPQDAIKRLAELQPGKAGSIFTSDLSVNEFLLVREAGFRPRRLVFGTSIYHVGLQVGRWAQEPGTATCSPRPCIRPRPGHGPDGSRGGRARADGIVGVRLDVEF